MRKRGRVRGRVKISLITNERQRKTTFMNRKRGMLKKLHKLTTLCDVQACAVIYSPHQSVLEAWPSREGVKEVASKFMEMPIKARTKHMMDQKTYLREKITKGMEKVEKLTLENRESQVRQFMFDCLEGKMSEYRYDARDLHDLKIYIQHYIDQLITRRMEILTENGESSSSHHFLDAVTDANYHDVADPTVVAHVSPFVVADATTVTAPIGFYDHIQYHNMNQNQKESVQYNAPTNVFDLVQCENMNMNQNQMESIQYQTLTNVYDQIQHGISSMNLNQDMNLDSNHNLNMNLNLISNQYPCQQESFMNPMVKQHMGHGGGHASIPFMNGNNYNYHHLPTDDLATTNHMPSIITTTSTTDDLATTNHMPSIITTTSTSGVYAPYSNNNI